MTDKPTNPLPQARLHWITYRWPVFWLIILIAMLVQSESGVEAIPGGIILLAFLLVRAVLRDRQSSLILTNDKIILHKGIIKKSVTALELRRLEAVKTHQGLFGRWWDFGTVTVTGTGGVRLTLDEVRSPESFKALVLNSVAYSDKSQESENDTTHKD